MITSFTCPCGANQPSDAKHYDGAVGYEAIVCRKCGRYWDHEPDGKPRENPPDPWSLAFAGIITDKAFYDKLFERCFNTGIDTAIKYCETQWHLYRAINPNGIEPILIDSIIKTLAHFKKPV